MKSIQQPLKTVWITVALCWCGCKLYLPSGPSLCSNPLSDKTRSGDTRLMQSYDLQLLPTASTQEANASTKAAKPNVLVPNPSTHFLLCTLQFFNTLFAERYPQFPTLDTSEQKHTEQVAVAGGCGVKWWWMVELVIRYMQTVNTHFLLPFSHLSGMLIVLQTHPLRQF